MLKHIKYYTLIKLVNDPILAAQVYHMIYQNGPAPKFPDQRIPTLEIQSTQEKRPEKVSEKPQVVVTQKQKLFESLSYLKSKSSKTKKDKESISILEAVLKNEKQ